MIMCYEDAISCDVISALHFLMLEKENWRVRKKLTAA
jgi:hypothetical protein